MLLGDTDSEEITEEVPSHFEKRTRKLRGANQDNSNNSSLPNRRQTPIPEEENNDDDLVEITKEEYQKNVKKMEENKNLPKEPNKNLPEPNKNLPEPNNDDENYDLDEEINKLKKNVLGILSPEELEKERKELFGSPSPEPNKNLPEPNKNLPEPNNDDDDHGDDDDDDIVEISKENFKENPKKRKYTEEEPANFSKRLKINSDSKSSSHAESSQPPKPKILSLEEQRDLELRQEQIRQIALMNAPPHQDWLSEENINTSSVRDLRELIDQAEEGLESYRRLLNKGSGSLSDSDLKEVNKLEKKLADCTEALDNKLKEEENQEPEIQQKGKGKYVSPSNRRP